MHAQFSDNLSYAATSFLGREAELADLARLLTTPQVRLLSICGLGGIGKTRLALEALARNAWHFTDGAALVGIEAAHSTADIIRCTAEALAIPLTGTGDPEAQLLAVLRDKEMLLLFDNAEQLGMDLVWFSRLLAAAPRLTLLVTSREALNLHEEVHYQLHGLPWSDEQASEPAAVRLFLERAGHGRPAAELISEREAIGDICRLLDGMPLAIELAAAWTRTLSCASIAAELRRGLDLLDNRFRNVPQRHGSLRTVCDHSWELLSRAERLAFARLSVLAADFSVDAATAIAGADLSLLDALIGKSFVRRVANTRYQIHTLLRQYGGERLAEQPAEQAHTIERTGTFFAAFLSRWFSACTWSGITPEALAGIEPELSHITLHWPAILAASDGEELRGIALLIQQLYFVRGPYPQGAALIAAALDDLSQRPDSVARRIARADCLNSLGWFQVRQGQIDAARQSFLASDTLYGERTLPLPAGDCTDPQVGLGVVALIGGDYREALRLGAAVQQRGVREDHRGNQLNGHYVLTHAALAQGHYRTAEREARQMQLLVEQTGNHWFGAYCQIALGHIACGLGEYRRAQACYAAAYELREAFGDPEGMATALAAQGGAALLAGAPSEAVQRYERSLAIYRYLGDQGGLAAVLDGLGRAYLACGSLSAAQEALREALPIAIALAFDPLQLQLAMSVAELAMVVSEPLQAHALGLAVARHPATDQATNQRAHQLLLSVQIPADVPEPPVAADDAAALAVAARQTLQALNLPAVEMATPTLIEPLTGREQEILAQIAAGRSNQEIADQLICSLGTVKWYTSQIYGKLGVKSRTRAVALARELGLID